MIVRLAFSLILYLLLQLPMAASNESSKSALRIGFIYSGPVSDLGWNHYHEQGRLYLEKHMNGKVQTVMAEKIAESSEAERVMEKMIAQGVKVIFTTSYGYLEPALRVAKRHPDVTILQCSERANPNPIKNLSTYFGNYYKTTYVVGAVAGRMTKKNEIGFVASHPIAPVLLNLNTFTLGARSVNPKIKVHVVWTNSWYDPPTEAEAARGLIDQGVDVIASDNSSAVTTVQVANKNQVYAIAFNADLLQVAPDFWLTGTKWDWGSLYVKIVQSIIDHTWHADDYRYGIENGYMQLSSFGKVVPSTVKKEAFDLLERIKQGKVLVFKGPMRDRNGKLVIPAGKVVDDFFLENTMWVVPGVEGPLPLSK